MLTDDVNKDVGRVTWNSVVGVNQYDDVLTTYKCFTLRVDVLLFVYNLNVFIYLYLLRMYIIVD